jgi:hypothetical protein
MAPHTILAVWVMTLLLHISPGNSAWRKQTSETDTRIYQFTGDKMVTDNMS